MNRSIRLPYTQYDAREDALIEQSKLQREALHPRAEWLCRGAGLHEMADEMKREQS